MKNLAFFSLSMLFISAAFAQTEYQQKEFIFAIPEGAFVDGDNQKQCADGLDYIERRYNIGGINPTDMAKFKIYALDTWEKTGKVVDNRVKEIGEILQCADFQTYWPTGRNLVPAYYEITIGGRKYRAAGAGTSPNFPELETLPGGGNQMTPLGYPETNLAFIQFNATVLPAVDGKPGGIFSLAFLNPFDLVDRPNYDHYAIGVLHVTLPVQADSP